MDHFKVAIVTNIHMRLKFKVARTPQFAAIIFSLGVCVLCSAIDDKGHITNLGEKNSDFVLLTSCEQSSCLIPHRGCWVIPDRQTYIPWYRVNGTC